MKLQELFKLIKYEDIVINKVYKAKVPRPVDADNALLRESIIAYGILAPITVNQKDVLLNGHTRYDIITKLIKEKHPCVEQHNLRNIPCVIKHFEDDLLELQFVIDINIAQRTLTDGQKSKLILESLDIEEELARRRHAPKSEAKGRAAEIVGQKYKISARQIDRIRKIMREGSSEIKKKYESGQLTTHAAYQAVNREERITNHTPLPKGKHNMIYIDWPLEYENKVTGGTGTSAANQKYDTLTPVQIVEKFFGVREHVRSFCDKCKFDYTDYLPYNKNAKYKAVAFTKCPRCEAKITPDIQPRKNPSPEEDISSVMAKDCVIFMWETVPMMEDMRVIFDALNSLGFKYHHRLFWIKTGHKGMGNWFSNQVETIAMFTRGKVDAFRSPLPNYVIAPVGKHSEKPKEMRNLLERGTVTMGTRNKLEMFAREKVPGWTTWGNEVQ